MTGLLNLLILSSEKKIIIGHVFLHDYSRVVYYLYNIIIHYLDRPLKFFNPEAKAFFSQIGFWVNPFRAPEPLPILNPSNFVPKNGFPVVNGLRHVLSSQIEEPQTKRGAP